MDAESAAADLVDVMIWLSRRKISVQKTRILWTAVGLDKSAADWVFLEKSGNLTGKHRVTEDHARGCQAMFLIAI